MGSLASIAASRVARFLAAGGPSFAVCDEEAGGLRAIALAVEALRNGEIDRALAGAVEFASDPALRRLDGWRRGRRPETADRRRTRRRPRLCHYPRTSIPAG